jgi:ribosome-associated protein
MAKQKVKSAAKKTKSAVKKSAPAKAKAKKSKPAKASSKAAPKKTAKKSAVKSRAVPKASGTKKPVVKPAKKAVSTKAAPPKKSPGKPTDQAGFRLAKSIVNAIEEKKGDNIVCLDLRAIENRVCDYFIICEGNSTTQIEAIAGSVEELVKKDLGERPYRSEGYENATWILIDYVNVIVHVFDRETRYFYNLESLWADGEKISF